MIVFDPTIQSRTYIPRSSGELRASRYNILVRSADTEDPGSLVYNTLTGAAAKLSVAEDGFLRRFDEAKGLSLREILENSGEIDSLFGGGFIVPAEADERAQVMQERLFWRRNREHLDLTIVPTLACNLRCNYCFQNRYPRSFSEADLSAVLNFSRRVVTEETRTLVLHWYGGEPTLCIHIIRALSPEIADMAQERDIDFHAEILTNAWNLDQRKCELLRDTCRIRTIQVSIDWPAAFLDRLRGTVGGFDFLLSRVELAARYFDMKIRVHCHTENIEDVGQLLELLAERGLQNSKQRWGTEFYVHFAMLYDFSEICGSVAEIKIPQDRWGNIQCGYLELAESLGFHVNWLPKRTVGKYCCAQCENAFLLVPGGYIYKCYRQDYGKLSDAVGHVTDNEIPYTVLAGDDATDRAECEPCVYLPVCSGACPDSGTAQWLESPCTPLKGNMELRLQKEWAKVRMRYGTVS